MKYFKTAIKFIFYTFFLWGCGNPFDSAELQMKTPPLPAPPADKFEAVDIAKTFLSQPVEQHFEQEQLEQNISFLSFQVKRADGSFLTNLRQSEIKLIENKLPITRYKLTKNSVEYAQVVDMVFVVDVTGSMTNTIERAKLRLVDFIKKSRESGYHTRMCLVTFGDYTIKKCDKFYENNPKDPATLGQVQELISEITKLKAIAGPKDPGGTDLNENPMRALIDATLAPWQTGDQRFAILITDDGFLYSPGNSGRVGSLAPQWKEIKKALVSSQMKVFAATPSVAGYNSRFGRELGIVELTQGEWFRYSDIVSGKISLDTILGRILSVVNTTFVAEYVVDEQEGLNASLPLEKRNVSVELIDRKLGQVVSLQLASNLPEGRREYAKQFKISDKKIDPSSLRVWINNQSVTDFVLLPGNFVGFIKAPSPHAKIKITYEYEEFKDSLILEPIAITTPLKNRSLEVFINAVAADNTYYTIHDVGNPSGQSLGSVSALATGTEVTLSFTDRVFATDDPFRIKALKKLDLLIRVKSKSP